MCFISCFNYFKNQIDTLVDKLYLAIKNTIKQLSRGLMERLKTFNAFQY